jgi:hypothetical protein
MRTTVAASMVNVKVASLLLGQHPLPREAARRHASCAHQCLLLGVKQTLHASETIAGAANR